MFQIPSLGNFKLLSTTRCVIFFWLLFYILLVVHCQYSIHYKQIEIMIFFVVDCREQIDNIW